MSMKLVQQNMPFNRVLLKGGLDRKTERKMELKTERNGKRNGKRNGNTDSFLGGTLTACNNLYY